MGTIEIKKDFIINNEKVKILSGAVHYFRIVPEYWEDTLQDLIDMGCNTVETYVPWNVHEPYKGVYDFEGMHDLEAFLALAHQKGLYVILRATPYICAEWEFGGLPGWLLKEKDMRLRVYDETFLKHVDEYFRVLLPRIERFQIHREGSVILAQLENEYGSYGEDKEYLNAIYQMMRKYGLEIPIFSADGTWDEALEAGTLLNGDVFPTGNFGSKAKENIAVLKNFMERHDIEAPIMCMEFWDGWFNRWNEPIIKRDPEELRDAVKEMIELGSINLYMFHGGTNFGWMNGCSARKEHHLPQITSYDYDGILNEYGQKTEKYHYLRELLTGKTDRLENRRQTASFSDAILQRKVSLFDTIETISHIHQTDWPVSMEMLDQYYGYIVYQHPFHSWTESMRMRIVDGRDRASIYLDQEWIATQYQEEIGDEMIMTTQRDHDHTLSIMVENMGRVNYGSQLESDHQRKGIRRGVILDIHYTKGWKEYCLDFHRLDDIQWKDSQDDFTTGFYEYTVDIEHPAETFLDMSGFGKGVVFVNGHHLGKYYHKGPVTSLYVPGPYLKKGKNTIVVFETEGIYKDHISLVNHPVFIEI